MIGSYTLFLLIISILLSFVIAFATAPPLISRMKSAGVAGIDVHKVAKPHISEMGGYAIYAGLATTLIVAAFLGISLELILISLLVVTLSAMVLSLIHISEPTRLGMISYAVFCLKKKKKQQK